MEPDKWQSQYAATVAQIRLLGSLLFLFLLMAFAPDEAPVATVQSNGEDFEAFYARFHAEPDFQLSRIQFPLQGVSSNPDDHRADFRWQAEDWQIHRPFAPESGFSSAFTTVGDDLVIERITDASGRYGLERRFARLDGESWLLIYYADLHPIQ